MQVFTTRFGQLEIAENRVIEFPKGLLGFSECRKFCILEPEEDAMFFWLQSLDVPALAFLVTDPTMFVPEYSAPIGAEQMESLGLSRVEDALVLAIVNRIDDALTGNLQGPLAINPKKRIGEQLVLAEKRWTTRHQLVSIPATSPQTGD